MLPTTHKIYSANTSIIEYLEQILVTCTSEKYELACLADSHAAQLIWRKEDCWSVSPLQAARCARPYFSYTNSL